MVMKKGFCFMVMMWVSLGEAKIVRTVSVSLVEERVNGKLFAHRIDVVDGVKKEKWSMDGKGFEQDEYDQKILDEELEERRGQRQSEYDTRVRLAEFKHEARSQVIKQLLHQLVQEVEKGVSKFDKYELTPYMVYTPGTIANEIDFSNITTYTVSPARDLLVTNFDPEKAKETIDVLEAYPTKLATLFEDSVNNAINKCDDPKRLKQWLEMLS
jgi:hypothetical protein